MIAFARAQTSQATDAEDLVQETFVGFLRSLDSYREGSRLETWLFRILRRRIVDHFRSRGSSKEISACALDGRHQDSAARDPIADAVDPDHSPSVYARQKEQDASDDLALSKALHTVIDAMKRDANLRDLMITEGVFYAGIKNRVLAQWIGLDEGRIAVIRHRLLKRLRTLVNEDFVSREDDRSSDIALPSATLLAMVWERDRPSCPKRTTLGKSLIGILDDSWQAYVTFHVETLGCRYCQANKEDLDQTEDQTSSQTRSNRIFQSTVGFIV